MGMKRIGAMIPKTARVKLRNPRVPEMGWAAKAGPHAVHAPKFHAAHAYSKMP